MLKLSVSEWEEKMLAKPLAGQVSGEHPEHTEADQEFDPNDIGKCRCDRCVIIRIKKRRAFRFPRTVCPECGELKFNRLLVPVGWDGTCEECSNKQ